MTCLFKLQLLHLRESYCSHLRLSSVLCSTTIYPSEICSLQSCCAVSISLLRSRIGLSSTSPLLKVSCFLLCFLETSSKNALLGTLGYTATEVPNFIGILIAPIHAWACAWEKWFKHVTVTTKNTSRIYKFNSRILNLDQN